MKKFVLSALLFSFAITTTSCMQKPEMEDSDGEPVEVEKVQEAVIKAWGNASPLSIGEGEFAYTEKTLAIADLPARVVLQEAKTVQSMEDSETERTYVILQQLAEIGDNNEQKLSSSERKIRITKSSLMMEDEGTQILSSNALPLSVELAEQLLYACAKGKNWDVTCYNLKTWDSEEPAPPQVASRPGCEGLANCVWRQKNISFDLVLTEENPQTRVKTRSKAKYHIKFSHDVPYLSRITEFCYQGIAGTNNSQFPVTICQKIRNFRR